ncbi:hypothetical protein VTO42DRAFT_8106 [Malbranchea cinnamomea]
MSGDEDIKLTPRESVETFLQVYKELMAEKNFNGYDKPLIEQVRLVDAHPNGVTWELDVTEYWTNMNGVMHGGAYGVIFDMCTAIAMNPISKADYWDFLAGVSRTINISYLKAIPLGTTIRIKCEVIQHGRRMALIRGVMESVDGKTVYATVEHHKTALPSKPEYAKRLREARAQRMREKSKI